MLVLGIGISGEKSKICRKITEALQVNQVWVSISERRHRRSPSENCACGAPLGRSRAIRGQVARRFQKIVAERQVDAGWSDGRGK